MEAVSLIASFSGSNLHYDTVSGVSGESRKC